MSKIPKPPSKIEKGEDVQSAAHDELLKWVYQNLDAAVPSIVGMGIFGEYEITHAKAGYREKLEAAKAMLLREEEGEDETVRAMRLAQVKLLENHIETFVTPQTIPNDWLKNNLRIANISLQEPLIEHGHRTDKIVGYVDIKLEYLHITEATLESAFT